MNISMVARGLGFNWSIADTYQTKHGPSNNSAPNLSQMHFDDDEYFTADQYSGTNLYYVATHEFGHVLGIRHTDVKKAVMGPYYPGI